MDANNNDRQTPIAVAPDINAEDDNTRVPYTDVPTDNPEDIAAKMDAKYGKRTNPQRLQRRK